MKRVETVEKFCIVVTYDIQLAVGKAREYFGVWDTRPEAEQAKKDVLVKKIGMWTTAIAEKIPILSCEVFTVFELHKTCVVGITDSLIQSVSFNKTGPYMSPL